MEKVLWWMLSFRTAVVSGPITSTQQLAVHAVIRQASLKPFGSEDIDAPHNLCRSSPVHVPFLDIVLECNNEYDP